MTGTIINTVSNPDYTNVISYIIGQAAQFILLSALIVGIVNQIKDNVSSAYKKYMWLVAIALGVCTLFLANGAFSMDLGFQKTLFFGVIVGMGSVGMYEGGLGKKQKKTDLSSPDIIDEVGQVPTN